MNEQDKKKLDKKPQIKTESIPDREGDIKRDYACLNLPERMSREDRQSMGDYDYPINY